MDSRINSSVIRLAQDDIEILLTKMNVEDLVKNTRADIYDSSKKYEKYFVNGYQRPLNSIQVDRIYEYLELTSNPIMPTSIILAISKEDIKIIDNNAFRILDYLRIVDGQHRIAAMKKKCENKNEDETSDPENLKEFKKWEYPVNIMILDKEKEIERYIEVRSFVDINKKGKKVSTDLADIVISNITKSLTNIPVKYAYKQISSNVVEEINKNKCSAWFEQIKYGDDATSGRIIGMASFNLSILPIIKKYVDSNYCEQFIDINNIEKETKKIAIIIDRYWEKIANKWEEAFNWDKFNNAYRVDSDYNIQKSLGVMSLHKVLNYHFKNTNNIDVALDKAVKSINECNVEHKCWEVGGEFSTYTSSSGHKN